jgi:DNA helicase-2/ATP-dependent DNA helicase PcrA
MDVSPILNPLNEAQREAVTAPVGHLLVLAGAGSGKTRVLVHRIAWLLTVEQISPWSVMAVTFTNKAAGEMRQRIESLLGHSLGGMWVGTFHGLAHRLLRTHWSEAGLPRSFQIIDSDDQLRLIKRILKNLNLDESSWPPRQVQWFINSRKDEGLRPRHLDNRDDVSQEQMIRLYQEYQAVCDRGGQVDFAELLLRAHELWRDRPDILQPYQTRFQHVLVDEFQDTNAIQYAWLRLLTGADNHLFVVGDDDQSIYAWRGAKVENLHQFQTQYQDVRVVRLEQNYRSTGNILGAANALIHNNTSRLGKQLWTEGDDGDPLYLYAAYNEFEETRFVIERIRQFLEAGHARSEVAILYRTTAQSRLFEEALIQSAMPYRVYGGLRFFERAEIKDALAYLRLINHLHDDGGFERAVNIPPRGIGPKTMDCVRAYAQDFKCSLWQASVNLIQEGRLAKRAAKALQGFLDLIDALRAATQGLELAEKVAQMLESSKLPEHYEQNRDGKGIDRKENLEELVNATRQFVIADQAGIDKLTAFLAHAALEAGEAQGDPYEDCIQLMTLHSAKGLEFPLVFLVGMEEGLFPHSMSSHHPHRLEEERRLCYVGITRAMHTLYFSYAERRRLHGSEKNPMPSRFLREIPHQLLQEVRGGSMSLSTHGFSPRLVMSSETGFHLGQRVHHSEFGEGVVLNAEGQGHTARVQVNFEGIGNKWLMAANSNLSPS